jgi:hypothetical protein
MLSNPIPPLKQALEQNSNSYSTDFDQSWYVNVGSKINNTWIINVVSPHFVMLFLLPLIRWNRDRKMRNAVVQREMNKWAVGDEFPLTSYYA